ncbi:hypothetical protein FM037_19270 [Shewanella psychropiezotolerans]|uniref:Uncharacterized protein n=1 Tax=Shewanella psychropiezotolerans TaxID=2593655 RepID=A0ABX5X0U5_9GAMM|nr:MULTISPECIES: hypothetical protein [Shewanella]MPY21391.1 hypothetical protein [Shewanella sp. YLB-07]MPY22178.1 hypothetical protein [Shewanella sp. YLB-07]QDO84971.1 hypothetical protein FM037_19270 [Shewanella psychropiezotolerans]
MMTVNGYNAYLNTDTHISKPSQVQASHHIASNSVQSPEPQSHIIDPNSQYQDRVTLSSSAQTAESPEADTYEQLGSQAKQRASLQDIMQVILDKRTGIDRDKLDEIEAQIQAIAKSDTLSKEQKEAQIKLLEEQKTQLIQEFVEKNEQNQQEYDNKITS